MMKALTPAGERFTKKVTEDILTTDFFAAALRSGHGPKSDQSLGEWVEQTFREANEAIAAKMSYEQQEGHQSSSEQSHLVVASEACFPRGNCGLDSTGLAITLHNVSDHNVLVKLAGADTEGEPTFSYALFRLINTQNAEHGEKVSRYVLHSLHLYRPAIEGITDITALI